ncbi:MAG: hypothetical protein HZB46_02715 [Solirubrobacterales bacterium]|nr:hypothetical protein [Solirubrobacterales bacterium]
MVKPPPAPSQMDTIEELLSSSKRDAVPVRHTFLQQRDAEGDPVAGPLARIVRRGVGSAAEQYLLLHARAAGRPDGEDLNFDVALESRVWARALGLPDNESGLRTVQRNWKALQEIGLVRVRRTNRVLRVTLLDEGGDGADYQHPGEVRDTPYLQLPYAYWLDGHAEKLTLPGKAMLLIALSLPDWFSLPFNKGPVWYGIGASTVERGIRELRRTDVLEHYLAWRKAPLLAQGWTQDMRYRLLPPFGPSGKVARNAPAELLLTARADDPPPQAEADEGPPQAAHASAEDGQEQGAQPEPAGPSRQTGSRKGKPKRRTPAATKPKGTRAGGAGRKPGPTAQRGR